MSISESFQIYIVLFVARVIGVYIVYSLEVWYTKNKKSTVPSSLGGKSIFTPQRM